MKYAKATTVKIARAEEEAHPSIKHQASCLCCGRVGEPAAWKGDDPSTYVCVTCKRASDGAAELAEAIDAVCDWLDYDPPANGPLRDDIKRLNGVRLRMLVLGRRAGH